MFIQDLPQAKSCAHTECTLHQFSPYIGKLKSSIAADLIKKHTDPKDIVWDPFCGSGTIPLEAWIGGRRTIAADFSPYAEVLTRAKLFPPKTEVEAMRQMEEGLKESKSYKVDLRRIPLWVRHFFHPQTLRECVQFASWAREREQWFLLSCFLGILHHQRPGFLSYPSSHLVPYLRTKKFPRDEFPELYEYRDLEPRLRSKISRSFKRIPNLNRKLYRNVTRNSIENIEINRPINAIITSPPYMNALDYGRDNRLRLWFLGCKYTDIDTPMSKSSPVFKDSMERFVCKCSRILKRNGRIVLIVGDSCRNKFDPAEFIKDIILKSNSFRLIEESIGSIPDIRRSRRDSRAVKNEVIQAYERRY